MGDHSVVGADCNVHQRVSIGAYAYLGAASVLLKDLVPYGLAHSEYTRFATLAGLNVRGLRRHGVGRLEVREMFSTLKRMCAEPSLTIPARSACALAARLTPPHYPAQSLSRSWQCGCG